MGGPSAEAKANEAAQTAFYKETTVQQKKVFGQTQDLFDRIKAVTAPILAKGPQQYGFTPEQDALLRGEITDRSTQATADAITATQLRNRQATGGTNILPTGGQEQLEATANVLGEQSKAKQLAAEKLTGYEAGSQLYSQALGALSGQQQILNPVGYSGAATGAGGAATKAVELADSERSKLLSTLLGGAIQGGLTLATGGASKAMGLPCWVARAVYGDDDPRWIIFRDRFFDGRYPTLSRLYLRFGRRLAEVVKRSKLLRLILKRLMDRVIYA